MARGVQCILARGVSTKQHSVLTYGHACAAVLKPKLLPCFPGDVPSFHRRRTATFISSSWCCGGCYARVVEGPRATGR